MSVRKVHGQAEITGPAPFAQVAKLKDTHKKLHPSAQLSLTVRLSGYIMLYKHLSNSSEFIIEPGISHSADLSRFVIDSDS